MNDGQTAWILRTCGWVWDAAAGAWLTPDGLTHVEDSEASQWAARTPMITRHKFQPLIIPMFEDGDDLVTVEASVLERQQ